MTSERRFTGISVLIPGYSVEDIPTDLDEDKTTGLLNAIACAWHPAVISAADGVPQFRYADLSEIMDSQQILMLPECSEEWLGHDWQPQLESGNCAVLHGLTERREWLEAINRRFGVDHNSIDEALISEFLALGLSWYLVMSLSRRMHYYIDPDEARLSSALRDAADAAVEGRVADASRALKDGFECMLETREQLFPSEGFLLDICLPPAPGDEKQLLDVVSNARPVNLLMSGAELNALQRSHSDVADRLRAAAEADTCCIVSGGWHELRSSLGSLSSAYSELHRMLSSQSQRPTIWGQRRFGLMHLLPGLLQLFDYDFGLHVALDDGIYPERENDAFHWNDSGSATILASSRLPIAIDGSASFLRLPERLAESMQQDGATVVLLARLPVLEKPWLDDLRRIHELCPLIGKFVTFRELHEQIDHSCESVRFGAGEYLGAHLIQSSVLRTEAPITGPADLHRCRNNLERLTFIDALTRILLPTSTNSDNLTDLDVGLQDAEGDRLIADSHGDPATQHAQIEQLNIRIHEQLSAQIKQFAPVLPRGDATGSLIVNPVAFSRETTILWPSSLPLPPASSNVLKAYRQRGEVYLRLKVPPGGFVQLAPAAAQEQTVAVEESSRRPLAEAGLLRNQYFEAILSPTTGGIADVRFHGQRANRVSQQVAFRYETQKSVPATETSEEYTTSYARTECEKMQVTEDGPWSGAIESRCVIRDVLNGEILFRFRQITRVERTVPRINVRIIPDPDAGDSVTGNPWMTYLACRFAWDNEAAAISRSLLGQVCGFQGERFESPDYIEVADPDQRLLIIPHGCPYHRRSGHRMLDCLLLVEGQPVPTDGFELTLEFDQPFPQRSVADVMQPVVVEAVDGIESASGWIFACSAKNVQVARVRAIGRAVSVVLQETEGRTASCHLRTARPPVSACIRKATGRVIQPLEVDESGVELNFASFEMKEVELTF
ncbi:MAG: hypothetical protein ABGZ35_10950 [Planctomycetaceae bacterium]